MKTHTLKIALCLSVLALLNACTSYNGKYNALSNRNINLYDITRDATRIAQGATQKSSLSVYVIIPSDKAATLEEAVDLVLSKYNGNYIADVSVTRNFFPIIWPYKSDSWIIQGNVMRFY